MMGEHQRMTTPREPSPMTPTDLPTNPARISLIATGWAACFAIWFGAITWIALAGDGNPMAYAALIGLLMGGVIVALLALFLRPLIALIARLEAR
ncbi:hypothetical protein [Tepidimonas sp.]|uniref:hypothetical protein n=1 Tax=Tepidimonas sp. TaxID=2002775 RepID=UPI002FE133BD